MNKIVLSHVSKLFGPRPQKGLERLSQGATKSEVQRELGGVVGVYDASLSVEAGETFVLMGLSGSGKSTLLRLVNRLLNPTAGRVEVDGVDLTRLSGRKLREFRREHFGGMVFQHFALLPHRTVLNNVAFGLELQGVPEKERLLRAGEMIERVGLGGFENSRPDTLSGGMQQRVGLARSLALGADILLMDEPFSALDPLIRRELQDELLTLQRQVGKTLLFVTHDLNEALRLGDRIAIMKDGRVVQVGTGQEIIARPADAYVSAFTEGVDRLRALLAYTLMQPASRLETTLEVGVYTPLSEVVAVAAKEDAPVAVKDAQGDTVGVITRDALLAALAGVSSGDAKEATKFMKGER